MWLLFRNGGDGNLALFFWFKCENVIQHFPDFRIGNVGMRRHAGRAPHTGSALFHLFDEINAGAVGFGDFDGLFKNEVDDLMNVAFG